MSLHPTGVGQVVEVLTAFATSLERSVGLERRVDRVTPLEELLENPREQPDGRVDQGVPGRLRRGRHDPRVRETVPLENTGVLDPLSFGGAQSVRTLV